MTSRIIYEVECGPEIHRIEIRQNKAIMLDHSEKTVKAFAAFDAPVPECVHWVERWQWMWHDIAGVERLTPPIGRYTDLILEANWRHVPDEDWQALNDIASVGSFTAAVSKIPAGLILYALPGPPEYMEEERREWIEENELTEHTSNLLKIAGEHGIAYVVLSEHGHVIPDLPLFDPVWR